MKKVVQVCMFVIFALGVAVSSYAQASQSGWRFQVDFLNLSSVGNDANQVQIFTNSASVRQSGTDLNRVIRVDYGAEFKPVMASFEKDKALLFSGGYTRDKWGVRARQWSTEGEWNYQDRIVSPPTTLSGTSTSQTMSGAGRGCRMWGFSLNPVNDSREESNSSPVECHAANSYKNSKMDVVFERPWGAGTGIHSTLQVGVSIAKIENHRSEGQSMKAFDELPSGIPLPPAFIEGFPTTVRTKLENPITLEGVSEASGTFIGPNLGWDGSFDYKRVSIGLNANTAMLIGNAKLVGEWTDIDRISLAGVVGGVPVTQSVHLEGHHPYDTERRVAVPVAEVHIKGSYRIRDWLSAGGGIFFSSWFASPKAPSWEVPGTWTNGDGTHWSENRANPLFYGLSFSANVSF